jgi:hypothetical protein
VGRHYLDVANVDRLSIMLEYVALDRMYFIVIEPILMFFYESYQKSDGILRGSLGCAARLWSTLLAWHHLVNAKTSRI